MKHILIATCTAMFALVIAASAQNTTVNGAIKYQTIHGLGVNVNPHSWNVNPGSVKKVLDSLVTGMGSTSFRLMFDDTDWEGVNDNNDPNVYNWAYYDSIYTAPRFSGVWNTVEYLNSKGITDITLVPVGATPGWMGGTKLYPGIEAEYAETIASMVHYGQKRRSPAIEFAMISPINETGCWGIEAPDMTTNQLGSIFNSIATHLINDGLSNVTLIGPDDCYNSFNAHALISNATTMSKLTHFGGHQYGNGNSTVRSEELIYAVNKSDYPDRGVILTEINAICNGCDGGKYNADYGFTNYAGVAYKHVLQNLNVGVNGIQLWEGYDSRWHHHHPTRGLEWGMWGIFAVNDTTRPDVFTARPHYYVFKQLYNFVKPGFKRIDISTTLSDMTISAFQDPKSGTVVVTGKNDSNKPQTIKGSLKNLSTEKKLKYYFTDAKHNFSIGHPPKIDMGHSESPCFVRFLSCSQIGKLF